MKAGTGSRSTQRDTCRNFVALRGNDGAQLSWLIRGLFNLAVDRSLIHRED
jgi:hypothetical protein